MCWTLTRANSSVSPSPPANSTRSGWFLRTPINIGLPSAFSIPGMVKRSVPTSWANDSAEQAGVALVFIADGIDTSTPSGRLLRTVLAAVAEFERDVIVERAIGGLRKVAESGRWPGGPAPFGFELKEGRLATNEAEASTIR